MQAIQIRSIRAKRGAEMLGCGESTFWHYAKTDPTFPRPRRLTPRMTVWDESELLAWRESRISAGQQEAVAA